MIRLLQAMAGAHHGGAETFFTRLVLALHRAGLDQRVAMRGDTERVALLRAAGIEPIELPFGGVLDLRTRLGLRRVLSAYRPSVVLSWMSRATRFCPRGAFVHVARLGGYYDLKHYRHCDHLIGNTRDIVAYMLRGGWPSARAHYLPNFVPALAAAPVPRASLGTPEDAPLALALGRLHPAKGFETLLDALAEARDLHLWLAGEGPLRGELEARATRLALGERLRFLGWRDDTAALLAAADLVVCPSRQEPLGNVVIEAWSARRPVVAAASVGPAALIRDGETGLLVPIDDAAALAAAMTRLAHDLALRHWLAGSGHAAYAASFSEPVVTAQYRAFFQEVAR